MMSELPAIYTKKGQVAYLQMNRPDKINAMNGEMYTIMAESIIDFDKDAELRCLIISGAGGNFSSGGDLAWLRASRQKAKDEGRTFQYDFPFFKALDRCKKPIIAALDGYTLASGFNTALLFCDIRVATPRVQMGHPSAKRGLTSPGNAGMYATPYTWFMGLGDALYIFLTGKMINGEEALRMGLVNEIVPEDKLMQRAEELAAMICESSPRVVAAQKQLLRRFQEVPGSFYSRLRELVFWPLGDDDYMEGTAAFLEKRKPNWQQG